MFCKDKLINSSNFLSSIKLIDPPKSLLVERIKNSTNRPLFQNKNNIKKKVDELYELRKTIYKKSNYIISSNLKEETLSIIKLES